MSDAQAQYLANKVYSKESDNPVPMMVKETQELGKGAFGRVVEATMEPVTSDSTPTVLGPFGIKMVPFESEFKSRELEILRGTSHPNIVALKYFYNYPNKLDNNKLYQHLVMECLPSTLQAEIRLYYKNKLTLPLSHVKVYSFQLARGMNYLHSFDICHRDIKPSNILIDPSTMELKICDFGSAKKLEPNQPSVAYISSRYYRAPELIVGCQYYTPKIDIWGFGCVMSEMLLGNILFIGKDSLHQLRVIAHLLGPPSKQFLHESNPNYSGPTYSAKLFSPKVSTRFNKVFNNSPQDAIDLLMHILVYEPASRFSGSQIMAHRFFDQLRAPGFTVYPTNASQALEISDTLFNFTDYEKSISAQFLPSILPNTN
ncbi:Ser/thr and tyrosine protein kinase [Komagataella phaffii CBS 7435]|uniref:Protein serine/threonine/tyrosine (Dual-specificity) kinase n=2 Tax=Komagataella phaffii TaxID=460519 RepID=C4R908_KOMPG|nr:Protein serine/threonine/tyrosine (dual-specificity) kinase [Komagataella phaffii GS115]AOA64684.1 GQ67_05205T0 [Komagataella phaffii]CAH2450508.1 Ser/thr and tyrosine protein kinase [Komagataella phaffii CBS 7435]AOA69541.1 GQ68_05187T0 [Komagataella phaffii GS115]CAY72083.1 Protein serine/threonine/tyrosine (dual-specificity) kinase [Komagataella phaffii GS115]CCA40314.1 Ser/thr and tyrosine protein kinase [Komagataella phaffii CBS 7435]